MLASTTLGLADDLPAAARWLALGFVLLTWALLFIEARAKGRLRGLVLGSGLLASLVLALAVLRPTEVRVRGREAPPDVVVLVDGSHRLTLPVGSRTRRDVALGAAARLVKSAKDARIRVLEFGEGPLAPPNPKRGRADVGSDLEGAFRNLLSSDGARPAMVVVVSDGRLASPTLPEVEAGRTRLGDETEPLVVHTVGVLEESPVDRSIRRIDMTQSAVAHQPFRLHVEVGCVPESLCESVAVTVREILEDRPPEQLALGTANGSAGKAAIDLEITLERAGARVIEVSLGSAVDGIPHNDQRLVPVSVRRDRTRMLHVAGRPTYDVRALRNFLKADASIDLISFFILRTRQDQVGADESELALIPFPVEELFTEHLPSFDAIILQDIDAVTYDLAPHFQAISEYVRRGGGLIMVGGPAGFSGGGYAGTPVEDILPVTLPSGGEAVNRSPLTPAYTAAGRAAPALARLRELLGEELPTMSGTNVLGARRPGAQVLWEHPTMSTPGDATGERMPLLVLGEAGDGRSIALALDATHKLRFGELGARALGEAHGALWEGLLGWLMRDPRYESAQITAKGPCLSSLPLELELVTEPVPPTQVSLELTAMNGAGGSAQPLVLRPLGSFEPGRLATNHRFVAEGLEPSAYAARALVGAAPPARLVFACEKGGEAHADSRPDVARLQAIAEKTGGQYRSAEDELDFPVPASTFVTRERLVSPLLPAWAWSTLAALLLGLHWLVRRLSGLA